jgi:YVTN family beta-propeller protein
MEFRILGPLEALGDGRERPLGGARQRAVLAILLLHRGESVSVDRIVDELWGGRPPETATKTVQVYVSRLRKALGDGVLVTSDGGYALQLSPDQVDADRFERLAREGREALERGDADAAADALRGALDLWRGPPLADLAYEDFAQQEIGRLEEERLGALEDRIDAELALGRHAALVPELEALVSDHPTRERLRGQLMLALYRSGRQADALEAYRDVQRTLDRELGLEPGPELQELERAILNQDPSIEGPRRASLVERVISRSPLGTAALLLAGGGLALLVAAIAAAMLSSGTEATDARANSVAVIDAATGELVADVPVGVDPGPIAADEHGIWVANLADDSISQINPRTLEVLGTTAPGPSVDGLATGAGGVWVTDTEDSIVVRLNPEFRTVADRIRVTPSNAWFDAVPGAVAVGAGSLWVGTGFSAFLARIDPRANAQTGRIGVGNEPAAIAVDDSGVWVADDIDHTVTRIDPGTNAVTKTTPVGAGPRSIAIGAGAVWVANTQDGTVSRIDPTGAAVTDTIPIGGRPTGVAVGAGSVWVADSLDGTVSRVDPETNEVVGTTHLGQSPQSLVVANGMVWVTTQASATASPAAADGADPDVLRVLLTQDPGPWIGGYYTCAALYNYPDEPFPRGSRLQPEVARGWPSVSDDGRTYTFRIRSGFRFSPPSNEPVTAAAFARGLERVLSPQMDPFLSYVAGSLGDIVGARAYAAGRTRDLAGVAAEGNRLMIRLVRPSPHLTARLAVPDFCAVPPDTPMTEVPVDRLPSAGPYYVDSYDPERSLVLRRNPNYDGPRPREFAEIDFEFGAAPEAAVAAVEGGSADYTLTTPFVVGIPSHVQPRLEARYGPDSEAAEAGAQRYFEEGQMGIYYLIFNTQRAPFDDPRLRRAVNFALDRQALAQYPNPSTPGSTARPFDQYLPPAMPGYEDASIYPLDGPDLERARRLAGDVHQRVTLHVCNMPYCSQFAEIVQANLAAIGLEVEIRTFPFEPLFNQFKWRNPPFDLAPFGWGVDYLDPYDFINTMFQADPPPWIEEASEPHDLVDDPDLNRRMAAAARLTGERRYRAYARLDHDLAAQAAPAAAYATGTNVHFFSERIGCQVNQPIYGIDLGRLCLRDEEE